MAERGLSNRYASMKLSAASPQLRHILLEGATPSRHDPVSAPLMPASRCNLRGHRARRPGIDREEGRGEATASC